MVSQLHSVLYSFIGFIVGCTALNHILLGPVVLYRKRKLKKIDQRKVSEEKYNNARSNADLANGIINVAFVVCFIVSVSILMLVDWKDNAFIPALLGFIIPGFMGNVMFPTKLIVMKSEIRNHIKAHLL